MKSVTRLTIKSENIKYAFVFLGSIVESLKNIRTDVGCTRMKKLGIEDSSEKKEVIEQEGIKL